MGHKICAIIQGVLTLALAYYILAGTVNDLHLYGILVPCSAAVAIGCWRRRRWLVALGALPILLYAFGFAILSAGYNFVGRTDELNFVVALALLLVLFEVTCFVFAGRDPDAPSAEDVNS